MALIKCSECQKEISDQAQACPNCGAPVKGFEFETSNVEPKKKKRGLWKIGCGSGCLLIIFIFFIFGYIAQVQQTKERAEIDRKEKAIVEEKRKAELEAFLKVKEEKYIELTKLVEAASWKDAQAIINQFKSAKLADYDGLVELEKKVKTGAVLDSIKTAKPEELEKNLGYYTELAKLNPDNKKYADKREEYRVKTAEKKEAERKLAAEKKAAELRKTQIESGFHPWDGSHIALERIIKESMNDPGSYEHVKTIYWDQKDHLIVLTEFRGKNAFGGLVKNWVKAKTSIDGSVLEIIEQGP